MCPHPPPDLGHPPIPPRDFISKVLCPPTLPPSARTPLSAGCARPWVELEILTARLCLIFCLAARCLVQTWAATALQGRERSTRSGLKRRDLDGLAWQKDWEAQVFQSRTEACEGNQPLIRTLQP